MKITDFIASVEWLKKSYSETTNEMLFGGKFRDLVTPKGSNSESGRNLAQIATRVSNDLAVVSSRIDQDSQVRTILQEFGLFDLLDPDFSVSLVEKSARITLGESGSEPRNDFFELVWSVSRRWHDLIETANHIEKLFIPSAVSAEKDYDDILTIETQFDEDIFPQPAFLRNILESVEQLYSVVSISIGKKNYHPLKVIFIASGTSFRFDFKGLGAPIKEMKELLVEAWTKIRHRKADDLSHRSEAVLGGLSTIRHIEAAANNGEISHEDSQRLKEQIIRSAIELFDTGTIIREIPIQEAVSNQELLQAKQIKLLPPSKNEETSSKEDASKAKPRRKTKPKAKPSPQRVVKKKRG